MWKVEHLRRALGRRPLLVDVALALATAGVSLVLGQQAPPAQFHAFDLLGYTLTCLANGALAARRSAPTPVLLLYCAIGCAISPPGTGRWSTVPVRGLTTREVEVLRLVGTGMSNGDIARQLVVGEATVKTHLYRTMTKLSLTSRPQAVVVAYETGLITPRRSARRQ